MEKLTSNWITEGLIDLEYKKYLLLGYLQSVGKQFDERKIYPFLAELISHYRNLVAIKENKTIAENNFPKHISKLDFENFKIEYENSIRSNQHLEIIYEIIGFAIPRIAASIDIAKEIYEQVEGDIEIHSVGIIPMHTDAGYLLFRAAGQTATDAFYYELSVIENAFEQFRGLKTSFIERYPTTIYNYEEAIKSDLIKKNRLFPNPATYFISTKIIYPFQETLFPVAKRCFVRYIERSKK